MKLALVFPGQGSQYVGMGQELYNSSPEARLVFERADEILGCKLSELCFNGPEAELKKTSITQPAILTTSIACLKEFKARSNIEISMVAGHSLGEYSALVAAGSISFEDAVKIAERRGAFMEEATCGVAGGMAAVLGLDRELVDKACLLASEVGSVEVANYNCPGQVVISGLRDALEKAAQFCSDFGAKRVIPLAVSGPFHSSLMTEAGNRLALELKDIPLKTPGITFINNVDAKFISDVDELKQSLVRQVSGSVLWEDTVIKMIDEGIDTFIEIGPGRVLTGLIKKIDRNVKLFNVEDLATLENSLAKLKEVI